MIIGITGLAQSGKSTLAEYISLYSICVIIAFADTLRDISMAAFGGRYDSQSAKTGIDHFWESKLFDFNEACLPRGMQRIGGQHLTGRRILQFLGTEMFRKCVHPDFFIFSMELKITYVRKHIIIPDVRFDNEAKWIKSRGGVVIGLQRVGQRPSVDPHASEVGVSTALLDREYTCSSLEIIHRLAKDLALEYLSA